MIDLNVDWRRKIARPDFERLPKYLAARYAESGGGWLAD